MHGLIWVSVPLLHGVLFWRLFNNINYADSGFLLSNFPIITHCHWSSPSCRITTIKSPSFKSLWEKHGFLRHLYFFQVRFHFLQLFLEMYPPQSTMLHHSVFFRIWGTLYKLFIKYSFLIIPLLRILKRNYNNPD